MQRDDVIVTYTQSDSNEMIYLAVLFFAVLILFFWYHKRKQKQS
ncbi:MAG: hypothetical protein PWQ49_615 [Methanohalophilus sp.]|nr:hypothetical protein [Methanohalophilus sp.]